jgi:hypothetical protein
VGKAVEFNGVDDTDARMLSEIRVVDGRWRLDSFAMAGGQSRNS